MVRVQRRRFDEIRMHRRTVGADALAVAHRSDLAPILGDVDQIGVRDDGVVRRFVRHFGGRCLVLGGGNQTALRNGLGPAADIIQVYNDPIGDPVTGKNPQRHDFFPGQTKMRGPLRRRVPIPISRQWVNVDAPQPA